MTDERISPAGQGGEDPILMTLHGLVVDPSSKLPIVLLKQSGGSALLPIWIGSFEANAIALHLEGIEPPRPLTHDLLASVLQNLDATVQKVIVSELRDNTFYARIELHSARGPFTLDSRPSDAIALALRTESEIYAMPGVLASAQTSELLPSSLSDDERLKQWLQEVNPEELGEYKM